MTVVSRWLFDVAFAASPQSDLAWSCFLLPLIEPDWQISRIRLSGSDNIRAVVPDRNARPLSTLRYCLIDLPSIPIESEQSGDSIA